MLIRRYICVVKWRIETVWVKNIYMLVLSDVALRLRLGVFVLCELIVGATTKHVIVWENITFIIAHLRVADPLSLILPATGAFIRQTTLLLTFWQIDTLIDSRLAITFQVWLAGADGVSFLRRNLQRTLHRNLRLRFLINRFIYPCNLKITRKRLRNSDKCRVIGIQFLISFIIRDNFIPSLCHLLLFLLFINLLIQHPQFLW